jgi:hypothetical protein
MKTKLTIVLILVFVLFSLALAWESHYTDEKYDGNGDMRFDSEHAQITKQSIKDIEWMDSTFSGLPECGQVKDFNSDLLGWSTLKTRTYCPASFSELPDFFYSVEDYINQGKECPPFNEWIAGDCHNFTHFMGALNSNHFPPQLRTNYEKYHEIAIALREMHLDLKGRLENTSDYDDYVEECAMEALLYESIAQHYIEDQWAMGHMWHRWGSPDINDFPVFNTDDNSSAFLRRTNAAFGAVIGAVSGMIHGWKSTVDELLGDDLIFEGDDYLALLTKNDAMCYYTDGVEWTRPLSATHYPGTGDLFLDEQLNQDPQGKFYEQRQQLGSCSRNSLKEIYDKDFHWYNYDDCWNNFATNRAMYIGLGDSPSTLAHMSLKVASKGTDLLEDSSYENLNDLLDKANLELTRLTSIFAIAADEDPYDTYLAEGYTAKEGDEQRRRLTLFDILPNDMYNKYPSYADPARNAPGDPTDATFVQKLDNELFGVRQVKYFNKCHAEIYCDDPSIINDYRQKCESGSKLDCQICKELAARFFLGEPPLCEILAPDVIPDPGNQNPPKTTFEISTWCGEQPASEFPAYYKGTSTFTSSVGSDTGIMRFSAYESGSVTLNYKGEGGTFYQSVYGTHENGSFTIEFNPQFSVAGTFNQNNVSCSGSNENGSASFSGTRVDYDDYLVF